MATATRERKRPAATPRPGPESRVFAALCQVVLDALYYPPDLFVQQWQALPPNWDDAVKWCIARGYVQERVDADDERLVRRITAEGIDRLRGRRR